MTSKGAFAARILASVASLILAALVIRGAVAGGSLETRPGAAANLAADPTRVSALRDLGLIADQRGEAARAMTLMSLAGRRSPLDGKTHLWLMAHRLASGDYDAAFADADMLLRHMPALAPKLTPILIAYAPAGWRALAARLATNPPWRAAFLIDLAAQAGDPTIAHDILSDLQETRARPTPAEWSAYFARRVKDGAYELAYLDWLRALPPGALTRAKAIYDGDFEGLPGVPPFNWRLGGAADMDRAEGPRGPALHAHYDGSGAPALAEQLLVLAPGSYAFSGQGRASGDASNALAWTLACAETPGTVLARIPAPEAAGNWRAFHVAVEVPDAGCAAQWLRLTPLPVDHLRPIEVWWRGLSIHRMDGRELARPGQGG